MSLTDFEAAVIERLKSIPRGRVTSYKYLAAALDRPKAARAVGKAVGKNPRAPQAPCHRVVKNNGELGGYARGAAAKKRLLEKEGIIVKNGKISDFNLILYKF